MLKRDISRTNVLIAAAGGMIGSGWLFSPFISAQMAGSNALMSWLIAALFMLFIALPLCELGAMFPISGGMTNYPSFTHGNDVGFLFAWTSWLSYVVMTPIEIQAILQYSSHLFPILLVKNSNSFTLSATGYIAAIGIMFFVVLLNSYGIKMLAECNKFASIIKFLVPSIAIIALLSTTSSMQNVHLKLNTTQAWVQIFTALSTGGIAFAFTGFQNGLMLAGEVQNPQRNIPIAILGAVLVGFLLYFMLQLSFLAAIPSDYLANGWQNLSFPGDSGPLVGLTLLIGLGFVAMLLMFDAAFSPFGTTLVYTAATSRILYGMALNKHLPNLFLKLNKHKIPYITLYVNFLVGSLSFLPFPGWQKMVAFLSSCSILSYGIGPICLLAMRKLQPHRHRPFKLWASLFFSHVAFYVCNLMLYWCGFDILWKLDLALFLGFVIYIIYQRRRITECSRSLFWFAFYMVAMLAVSYFGSFGGRGQLQFPLDIILILPLSILVLQLSQYVLVDEKSHHELTASMELAEAE
ncbi:APC family permease [Legionella jordanis]|uniref:Aspartate-proton symporter n=1 Tax=Legionella jordanis TaxID=456 RepID=A0A0W0VBL5_9GAMM|nr:APC family permease [Legionella jordanis]KTD17522.1 Aspartate-proton symporter [Legionella jordanis]RMX05140.1 APC family permease [Legionella jordanis]RMX17396.1 APC family permease [Legionella jordanis]VEH13491.1 amino acid transporters [Legionella jordanis]